MQVDIEDVVDEGSLVKMAYHDSGENFQDCLDLDADSLDAVMYDQASSLDLHPTIIDDFVEFSSRSKNEYDPTIEDVCLGSRSTLQLAEELKQYQEVIFKDSLNKMIDRSENLNMLMEQSCEKSMPVGYSTFASSGQERFRSSNVPISRSSFPVPMKEEEDQDEFWGFTEVDRRKREFVKELTELSEGSEGESVWYSNLLASIKYDAFCEILSKFSDRKMLTISRQRRTKIYQTVRKIFEVISVELKLNSSGDKTTIWKQNILEVISRPDVQLLTDDILEGDLIYKIASESLLKNGLNSLGNLVSGEFLSYVKVICCVLRCAVAASHEDDDERQLTQIVSDVATDWIWPDFVYDDFSDDYIRHQYETIDMVSQIQLKSSRNYLK